MNPNLLTFLGLLPSLLFFVFVIFHLYLLAIIAFIGNIFDLLDGMVARKYHKVTAFGGFLDSTLDRVSDFFIISAFAFGGLVRWEIAVVLLFVSFLISYMRSRGELAAPQRVKFDMGIVERSERLVIIFFSLVFFLVFPKVTISSFTVPEAFFIILILLSLLTVFQRGIHAYKNL